MRRSSHSSNRTTRWVSLTDIIRLLYSFFCDVLTKPQAISTELDIGTLSDQVEAVMNGVEVLKVEDGEQEEVTQPRVTKAQKRRVRRSNSEQ